MTKPRSSLAAVVYDKGAFIDDFMRAVADRLRAEGMRVGGVFQENAQGGEAGEASCAAVIGVAAYGFTTGATQSRSMPST